MGLTQSFITDALEDIKRAGLYRFPRIVEEVRGAHIVVDGREILCFCSNDYLGIAQRPDLADAAAHAAREAGWGAGSARLLSGTTPWHVELEERIARFKKTEAALFFPSGYMANLAMVTTIADENSLVLSDLAAQVTIEGLLDGEIKGKTLVSAGALDLPTYPPPGVSWQRSDK